MKASENCAKALIHQWLWWRHLKDFFSCTYTLRTSLLLMRSRDFLHIKILLKNNGSPIWCGNTESVTMMTEHLLLYHINGFCCTYGFVTHKTTFLEILKTMATLFGVATLNQSSHHQLNSLFNFHDEYKAILRREPGAFEKRLWGSWMKNPSLRNTVLEDLLCVAAFSPKN